MKIALKDGNFITDNSLDCQKNCYFVLTNSNKKFAPMAQNLGANIIKPKEAINLLNLKPIKLVGITGTNGKTTTAALICHILNYLGHKTGLCGTRGAFVCDQKIAPKGLTTSQFLETLSYIKAASEAGCEYFVMEVSSHAIAQNRIESLDFDLKIFTNLTQDHLDYHKSFDEYARVKSDFFSDESLKLINKDDKFIKFNKNNVYFYSCQDENADFVALNCDFDDGINAKISVKFDSQICQIKSNMQGKFNLYNILCAISAVNLLGFNDCDAICDALGKFGGVEGRLEVVSTNPLVIVDFAHTPDGIEKVLSAMSHKDLIVVFGAGGDRDKTKRPIMGQIVEKYAKIPIITSDNPRSENPSEIINEIKSGMKNQNVICIEDRKEAIAKALNLAVNGQTIAILGKGDETTQEINGVLYPFSDKEVVLNLLKDEKI